MRLIRVQGNDQSRNSKLIVKICELRIKLNQMNENDELNMFRGHQLTQNNDDTSSLICDICAKKQTLMLLPPAILKNINFNFVLSCTYCDIKIHRDCVSPVSN